MSEIAPRKNEQHESQAATAKPERAPTHAHPEKSTEKLKHEQHEALSEARKNAAETARPHHQQHDQLKQLEAAENTPQMATPANLNSNLKRMALRRELQSIRRKLPARERALSRLIHQPAVRVVSEAASKSVSRPSGLLGGGLVAFLGTSSYLYLAKHLGFTYNYIVFLALFAAGFVVGIGLELIVYLSTTSRRQAND